MFMFLLTGYSGDNCLTYTDPCSSNPCHSTSACKSEETRYMCYCTHGEVLTDTGCKGNELLHLFCIRITTLWSSRFINVLPQFATVFHMALCTFMYSPGQVQFSSVFKHALSSSIIIIIMLLI